MVRIIKFKKPWNSITQWIRNFKLRAFVRSLKPYTAAAVSGLLLSLAYEPVSWLASAWFAFVPLLISLRYMNARQSMKAGWVAGFVFWVFNIAWLHHVTWLGCFMLAGYLALYWVPFAFWASGWFTRWGWSFLSQVGWLLGGAGLWVALEYLRACLFTGFGWNLLGVSQHPLIPFIQMADLGGVYIISFLVIAMNLAYALYLFRIYRMRNARALMWCIEIVVILILIAGAVFYGKFRIAEVDAQAVTPFKVAAVQPNIPQDEKWTYEFTTQTFEILDMWTRAVADPKRNDLVVWPETAIPAELRHNEGYFHFVKTLATNGVPLLVGTIDTQTIEGKNYWYNSSMWISPDGEIVDQYDKQHLVMFGEYVPFAKILLPIFAAWTPLQENMMGGEASGIFLEDTETPFATLICFEDTLPALSRKAVNDGARWLINQTNDGWFDPSVESMQHAFQARFRCIENRVPMFRCANSGYTVAYDAAGRESDRLLRYGKTLLIDGVLETTVDVPIGEFKPTFYTRYGDLFALITGGLGLLALGELLLWFGLWQRQLKR